MAARHEGKDKLISRRNLLERVLNVPAVILLFGEVSEIAFNTQVTVAQSSNTDSQTSDPTTYDLAIPVIRIAVEEPKDTAVAAALEDLPTSLFPSEFASFKRDLVIANFGLKHGIKVEDSERDKVDQVITALKELYTQRGKIWKPVYVETHDDFRELPDFVPTQRLFIPEYQIPPTPDFPAENVGLRTYAFEDLSDMGDSLRIRICFNPGYTEDTLYGQLFKGDDFAEWRRFRAAQNMSAFIAEVLDFNNANSMRWPSEPDEKGIYRLKLDPVATSLSEPNPFAQVL